ncbi:hypothetical protein AMECASPLE_013325 [Ameca splendens]|uniref:Uncharacterized protein n=1 Tax=Ameca splendens TaxID=208324 RepID=A0ABV0XQ56_9TELE
MIYFNPDLGKNLKAGYLHKFHLLKLGRPPQALPVNIVLYLDQHPGPCLTPLPARFSLDSQWLTLLNT